MANSRREFLYWAQKGKCHYCDCNMSLRVAPLGERASEFMCTIDHVVPVSMGGGDNIENTVAACFLCNNNRGIIAYKAFRWFVKTHGRNTDPFEAFAGRDKTVRPSELDIWMWSELLKPKHVRANMVNASMVELVKLRIEKQSMAMVPNPAFEMNEPKWKERRRYLTMSRRNMSAIVNAMPYQTKNMVWGKYLQEEKRNAINPD